MSEFEEALELGDINPDCIRKVIVYFEDSEM